MLLGIPPLYLIYYSYDIYVKRAREKVTFDAERDSFHEELAASVDLHDELRAAQLKVAAEIERARRIQTDLLPTSIPQVDGIELEQRIEFLGEMGGDYYDYIPFGDGRLGIVCGDVMGKGLAAALIMAMARSLLHDAIAPGKRPGDVMAEVNDGLTRDLEGQRLPYFLTLALAVYDPSDRSLVIAGGGHNPVLVADERRRERGAVARRRPRRPHRPAVPRGPRWSSTPAPRWRSTPTASPRRATPRARCSAWNASSSSLERCQSSAVRDTLDGVWGDIVAFRGESAPTDDATLLLVRLT